ncbi:MAG: ATP-binding protein [Verrucomicrobiota bacterium]
MQYVRLPLSLQITSFGALLAAESVLAESEDDPKLSQIDREIAELKVEIDSLPKFEVVKMPMSKLGFRAFLNLLKDGNDSPWIQIDFGKVVSPDTIAIIPDFDERRFPVYFPKHFQLSMSLDESGRNHRILYETKSIPFQIDREKIFISSNPNNVSGRYLRLTFLDPMYEENGSDLSLECRLSELLVYNGESNLALGKTLTTSLQEIPADIYKNLDLVDGWFPLGAPEDPRELSRHEGFHSYHSGGQKIPEEPYWVQVDLEEEFFIDQVNLIPTIPTTFTFNGAYAFPKAYALDISTTEAFNQRTRIFDSRKQASGPPSYHCLSFPVASGRGRFVRLTVYELESLAWGSFCFTMGELQVISNGENVAKEKRVSAERSLDEVYYPRIRKKILESSSPDFLEKWNSWSEARQSEEIERAYFEEVRLNKMSWANFALVDGFSSRFRLMPMPEWLLKAHRREQLLPRLEQLSLVKYGLIEDLASRRKLQMYAGISISTILFLGLTAMIWIRLAKRNRKMRKRLAQDLHDDLSSELCSVALISELLEAEAGFKDEKVTKRLQILVESSRRSLISLKDIIFLTDKTSKTWSDSVLRFQEISQNLLQPLGIKVKFTSQLSNFEMKRIAAKTLRDIFLIYKEALNNVRRHSKADEVKVYVSVKRKVFSMLISDNGVGLNTESKAGSGFGLTSMKLRAKDLGGEIEFMTGERVGTSVKLTVPIK